MKGGTRIAAARTLARTLPPPADSAVESWALGGPMPSLQKTQAAAGGGRQSKRRGQGAG